MISFSDANDTATIMKSSDWSFAISNAVTTSNGLVVGLGGGLFLVVIVWLALITVYACREIRAARHSLTHLQRQYAGYPMTYSSNPYDSCTLKNKSERTEIQEADTTYEALELEVNDEDYEPIEKKPKASANGALRFTKIQAELSKQLRK